MDIKVKINDTNISREDLDAKKTDINEALDRLWSGEEKMTGWVKAPLYQDKEEMEYILNVADIVKQEAELMVVIGIGGSYMGAKAAIEALPKSQDGIDVKFAGINFSTSYHRRLMNEISSKETILCVISKSGNTLEVKVAFDILKSLMVKKYGSEEAAAKRIITITDKQSGALREETKKEGYLSFEIPRDIGGRYSVFTPAGLFPMSVAGIDISQILGGAEIAASSPDWDKTGADYAVYRFLMMQRGKTMEAIGFFDPRLSYLGEWLKQLYGESEGKEGKGLFPVTLNFSTDLHSLGQFLQQGRQMFFETLIVADEGDDEIIIPQGELEGKSLEDLNHAAFKGVTAAHGKAGIPVIEIHMAKLDAFYYGQLLYFFETTCALTAMLMGVDPFDQPGVEAYKEEMRKNLL